MAVDPIHAQRSEEIAERMALEVRAKVTGQRQRIAHLDPFRLKRAVELCAFLLQHLQVEPVVVRNKQNVRPEEIEKLMERICRLDAMFIEIIHTPGDDRRDRPLQSFSIGTLEAAKAAAKKK